MKYFLFQIFLFLVNFGEKYLVLKVIKVFLKISPHFLSSQQSPFVVTDSFRCSIIVIKFSLSYMLYICFQIQEFIYFQRYLVEDTSLSCQGCRHQATLGLDIHNHQVTYLHILITLNSRLTVIILNSLLMVTILKCHSFMLREPLPHIHHKLELSGGLPHTHLNCLVSGWT